MFNLREPGEYPVTTTTAAASSASTVVPQHTLTNIEDVDSTTIYEALNDRGGLLYGDIPRGHDEESRSYFLQPEMEMVRRGIRS